MRTRSAECRDAVGMARASVESQFLAAYRGILPWECLMQVTYEKVLHNWTTAIRTAVAAEQYIYVAESEICGIEGGIIGVAAGGKTRREHPDFCGEISFLYVLPEYQSQGLGRKLVIRIVERLQELGMHTLLIRVLQTDTSFRRFCEALGGSLVPDQEEQVEQAGKMQGLVAYGWRDVSVLLMSKEAVNENGGGEAQ